jgi:hypothetical protein
MRTLLRGLAAVMMFLAIFYVVTFIMAYFCSLERVC